ncbi:MAG: NTP transferase domain-containing protein [Eubacteriales bacterium]|nr:NTP transferase domain-containing protein [Eubacteriales bacterium]MDD4078341.1 NTP transferase domain-containing protein [Eubacteriales bacterium]
MKPIYAVVLAGDSEDRKIKQGSVVANKAFLSINGCRMVDYVLDCYRGVKELAGVSVIGPEAEFKDLNDVTVIPQRDSLIANVKAAAAVFTDGWLLLSSCDIPLVTPAAITDLLSRCQGADMYYPMVSKADCQRAFPDMERTWVKLADGEFTGGNIILIKSCKVALAADPAEAFFVARKSPVQLASLIGIPILAKLLINRLTVSELEKKMEKILGITCKAVQTPYPAIGTDVDKESDYNIISAQLKIAK